MHIWHNKTSTSRKRLQNVTKLIKLANNLDVPPGVSVKYYHNILLKRTLKLRHFNGNTQFNLSPVFISSKSN